MRVTITTLQKGNIPQTLALIEETIRYSYRTEFPDILNFDQTVQEEIDWQRDRLEQVKNFGTPYFFIARHGKTIVGTLAYGIPEDTVREGLRRLGRTDLSSVVELKSLFIKPSAQRQGVGSKLFAAVTEDIREKEYDYLTVFTGFLAGKSFWEKQFGKATIILEQYDGEEKLWVWVKKITKMI